MKKILLILLIGFSGKITAQSLIGGKNIIKANLSSVVLNNYHITYERSINHFMSLSASYRTMPKGSLPLKSLAKKFIDNPNINFDALQIGNTAITFESRFYLGLAKMSGFYLAPYARFANFDLNVPVSFSYIDPISNTTIPKTENMNGTIRSKSFGAYFGLQKQLLTKLVLDVWVIGGHYGNSNGLLEFKPTTALPSQAYTALSNAVNETNANPFTIKSKAVSGGVEADMSGPWAGIRGLGISLGLRF